MASGTIKNQLKVQNGYVNAALESNKVVVTHVNFPVPFQSVPGLTANLATAYAEAAHIYMANLNLALSGLTTEGFDIRLSYNGTTGTTSAGVRWMAIGY